MTFMTGSPTQLLGAPRPALQTLRVPSLAGLAAFVIRAAMLARESPWQLDEFPEALPIKAELLPWLFPLHMITGGLRCCWCC